MSIVTVWTNLAHAVQLVQLSDDLAANLGLTSSQIDQFFIAAAAI